MSPLGLKIIEMLRKDPDVINVWDASRSAPNGRVTDEVIRVRIGELDYDIVVEART